MYVVYDPDLKLSKKAQEVVDVCKAGGFVRYALENVWGGREQFKVRVYDSNRMVVKGLGYRAAHDAIAKGLLKSRPCPRSSLWPQEWEAA